MVGLRCCESPHFARVTDGAPLIGRREASRVDCGKWVLQPKPVISNDLGDTELTPYRRRPRLKSFERGALRVPSDRRGAPRDRGAPRRVSRQETDIKPKSAIFRGREARAADIYIYIHTDS